MPSKLLLILVLLFSFSVLCVAQDRPQPNQAQRFDADQQDEPRPALLEQLGLIKEQIRQFRLLNQEHRPKMQAAQQRLREANRELDQVIYADAVSEDLFQQKLRSFQDAQNEVNRLRFANELAIRRILTHEQVVRFREMRRRFAEARDRLMPQQQRRNERTSARPTVSDQRQPKTGVRDQPMRNSNQRTRPIN